MKTFQFVIALLFVACAFAGFSFDFHLRPEFQKVKNETKMMQRGLSTSDFGSMKFNCPKIPPSNPPPVNARRLRFSDIKVTMSFGDSMTAGFAINDESYVSSVFEYRGWVATSGNDTGRITLPNFFKSVGADVKGGSVGRGLPISAYPWNLNPNQPKVDQLNGARSGARSEHLKRQSEYLAKQLKVTPGVDFENDWKHTSLIIGANDLCGCNNSRNSPDNFEKNINDALAELQRTVPKVFVSIFPIFETGFFDVWTQSRTSLYCTLVFEFGKGMCGCLMGSDADRRRMHSLAVEYNKKMIKIAEYWNAKNIPDFYVAVHPFLKNIRFTDLSWLSKFDCFHPSNKANEVISVMAWNSLQLPADRKPTSYNPPVSPTCPTENTFMQ